MAQSNHTASLVWEDVATFMAGPGSDTRFPSQPKLCHLLWQYGAHARILRSSNGSLLTGSLYGRTPNDIDVASTVPRLWLVRQPLTSCIDLAPPHNEEASCWRQSMLGPSGLSGGQEPHGFHGFPT